MDTEDAYIPDEYLRLLPFDEECEAVDEMAGMVPRMLARGLSPPRAFFQAWSHTHPSPNEFDLDIGADALFGLMVDTMVLRAQAYYNHLRDGYLWAVAQRFKPHNAASNPVDPIRLLELSQHGNGRVDTRVYQQIRWEAKTILASASGFMAMELAHPERWIASEVTRIDKLSSLHLFAPVDLVDVYVVYAVDKANGGRVIGQPFVTLDERLAKRVHRRPAGLLPAGGRIFMHHFQCRTVVGPDGTRWLVENDDRRKTYFARLLKRHDRGTVRDSCGTSYNVVARIDPSGNLSLGTRADVDAVRDLTAERLWRCDHLYLLPPRDKSQRHRHPDYWDCKLLGHIGIWQDGCYVKAFVEQIITSVVDYLNQYRATDALNHQIRRGEQLAIKNPTKPEHSPPAWQYWPADIYPKVDWSSDATIALLRRSWAMRFAERARKA